MLKPMLLAFAILLVASFALPSPNNPDLVNPQLTALAPRIHQIYIREAIQGRFVEVMPREDLRDLGDLDRRESLTQEQDDQAEDVHIEARTHRQTAAASTTFTSSAAVSSSSDLSTASPSSVSSSSSSFPSSPSTISSSSSSPSTTSSSSASASSSSASEPTSAPTAKSTPPPPPPPKQQNGIPIAGIAVGVILGVIIFAGAGIVGFLYYRRSRKRKEATLAASSNRDSLDPSNNPTVAASGGLNLDEDLPNFSQRNSTSTRSIEDMFERRGSRAMGGPLSSNPMNYIPLDHMQSRNPADLPEPEEDPPYDPSRTSSVYDPPPSSRSHGSSLYDPPSSGLQADRCSYERSRPGSGMLSPGLQNSPLRNQMARANYYETPDDVGRRFSFEAQTGTAVDGSGARGGSSGA